MPSGNKCHRRGGGPTPIGKSLLYYCTTLTLVIRLLIKPEVLVSMPALLCMRWNIMFPLFVFFLLKRKPMIKVSGTPPCVVGSNLKTESKCFVFASIPSKTLHLEKNYENRKSDWKLFPELPQRSTTSLKHGSDGSALPPIKSRVSDNSQLSQITQFSNWYVQLRISQYSGNLLNQTLIKTRVDSNKLITLLSWPILTNLIFVFVSCLTGQSVKRSLLDW